jgi:hypothetical protein
MGATSAVGLTNVLTNVGIEVDQLTTVDAPSARRRLIFSHLQIKHPEKVKDALNYIGALGKQVHGAKNEPITPEMRKFPDRTPMDHRQMEDITAPKIVERIERKLTEIFYNPKKQ